MIVQTLRCCLVCPKLVMYVCTISGLCTCKQKVHTCTGASFSYLCIAVVLSGHLRLSCFVQDDKISPKINSRKVLRAGLTLIHKMATPIQIKCKMAAHLVYSSQFCLSCIIPLLPPNVSCFQVATGELLQGLQSLPEVAAILDPEALWSCHESGAPTPGSFSQVFWF